MIHSTLARVLEALKISSALTIKYLDMVEGDLDGLAITELREIHYQAKQAITDLEAMIAESDTDYKLKYDKLKEFVRGKWKGDCSECASIANDVFNKESATPSDTEKV